MTRKLNSVLLTALALGLCAGPAWAGIVVLKNGQVVVGKIKIEEDTQEELVVRWPHGEREDKGEMVIPKRGIRWYSRKVDRPTDEYWEKFSQEEIDEDWHTELERWRLREESREEMEELLSETGESAATQGADLAVPKESPEQPASQPATSAESPASDPSSSQPTNPPGPGASTGCGQACSLVDQRSPLGSSWLVLLLTGLLVGRWRGSTQARA